MRPPKPAIVGIPGGTQHPRKNGVEERDWTNVDGTTVYRVTRPIANPQEAAEANAAKKRG